MIKTYTFFVNGNTYCTNKLITISDLLKYFRYESGLFIIEFNNSISHEKDWSNIKINESDKIEIITIVGGG